MRYALVAEGSTDLVVLGRVVRSVLGEGEITPLVPMVDDTTSGHRGQGWQSVRAFVGSAQMQVAMRDFDVVVVHVDADVRRVPSEARVLAAPAGGEGEGDLDLFCDHVKGWFRGDIAPSVVIVLPREATEAWLVACVRRDAHPEAHADPAERLAAVGKIPRDARGRPRKLSLHYARMTEVLVTGLGDRALLGRVPELERFVEKLRSRGRVLRGGKKRGRGAP